MAHFHSAVAFGRVGSALALGSKLGRSGGRGLPGRLQAGTPTPHSPVVRGWESNANLSHLPTLLIHLLLFHSGYTQNFEKEIRERLEAGALLDQGGSGAAGGLPLLPCPLEPQVAAQTTGELSDAPNHSAH